MVKIGEDWNGLHLGKCEKTSAHLFSNLRYVSLHMYQNFINTAGKSSSVVMWPWFCKWKTLGQPIWRLELTITKIKKKKKPKIAWPSLWKECELSARRSDVHDRCLEVSIFSLYLQLAFWENCICPLFGFYRLTSVFSKWQGLKTTPLP